jgi:pimeloyl-ACP methyl ester carboxylesterase
MASFVLVPGAGGMAWYWHRMVPLLSAAGHEAIAVDLPGDDRDAGLAAYADIVIRAMGERNDVVLVAQSLAGFTAPLVCTRAPVQMLVFVNAMIPRPGESAGAWWSATAATEARERTAAHRGYATEFDMVTYFLHDVPQDMLRAGPKPREQADTRRAVCCIQLNGCFCWYLLIANPRSRRRVTEGVVRESRYVCNELHTMDDRLWRRARCSRCVARAR